MKHNLQTHRCITQLQVHSQTACHILTSQVKSGVSFVRFLEKSDCAMSWFHCTGLGMCQSYHAGGIWCMAAMVKHMMPISRMVPEPWKAQDWWLNTLRPRQNGHHFPHNIFLTENVWISIKISLKFVPKGPINYIPALVQIMGWRRPGD